MSNAVFHYSMQLNFLRSEPITFIQSINSKSISLNAFYCPYIPSCIVLCLKGEFSSVC
jgi:hypothetical protein